MRLVDVHAHLMDEQFENVDEIVKNALDANVEKIICSAYSLEASKKAVEFSHKFDCVFANVGLHPENVGDICGDIDDYLSNFETLAKDKKVVAIGEIGLDFHFFDDVANVEENKAIQKIVFEKQIELANRLNLPIVVHSRDAMGETLEILRRTPPKKPSLLHCYSGSLESAEILMKLGFSFSFGGVTTFKNAKNVKEVVRNLPAERILTETDCPYMSPEPFRGTRNEPKNIVYILDQIAKLKEMPIEDLAEVVWNNAERLFG